jgi:hypothetical protein
MLHVIVNGTFQAELPGSWGCQVIARCRIL